MCRLAACCGFEFALFQSGHLASLPALRNDYWNWGFFGAATKEQQRGKAPEGEPNNYQDHTFVLAPDMTHIDYADRYSSPYTLSPRITMRTIGSTIRPSTPCTITAIQLLRKRRAGQV
jgi:hypothetical protein